VSALFIVLAIGAGFLCGLRVGLALGHKTAMKKLARGSSRRPD
jgi:hypothetical protein